MQLFKHETNARKAIESIKVAIEERADGHTKSAYQKNYLEREQNGYLRINKYFSNVKFTFAFDLV